MNAANLILGQASEVLPIGWTIGLFLLLLLAFSMEQLLTRIDRRLASFEQEKEGTGK